MVEYGMTAKSMCVSLYTRYFHHTNKEPEASSQVEESDSSISTHVHTYRDSDKI